MEEVGALYQLLKASAINLEHFFLFYKNILTSIDNVMFALFKEDVDSQLQYITKKQYNSILKDISKHQDFLMAMSENDFI